MGRLASFCDSIFGRAGAAAPSSTRCSCWLPSAACGREPSTFPRRLRSGGKWRPRRASCRPNRFLGSDVDFFFDHSRLPGHALAGGTARAARCPCRFLHSDDGVYRAYLRQGLLPRPERAPVVLRLLVLPGAGRGQFRRLYPLASGAISHGMPRQRFRFLHLIRQIRRGWNYILGGKRRATLRITRHAGRADVDRLRAGTTCDSVQCGDARPDVARLGGMKQTKLACSCRGAAANGFGEG